MVQKCSDVPLGFFERHFDKLINGFLCHICCLCSVLPLSGVPAPSVCRQAEQQKRAEEVVTLLQRPGNNGLFFSWITVASSPLPSHWSTMRPYSQKQEAVTNRNYFPSQSEGPPLRWLLFKVPFFDEISAPILVFFVEKHNFFSLDC